MKNILREKREEMGISQVRLGTLTGLPNSVISDFELGKRLPWPRARKALAKALGVTKGELFPSQKEGTIETDRGTNTPILPAAEALVGKTVHENKEGNMKAQYKCRKCGEITEKGYEFSPQSMITSYSNPAAICRILFQPHQCKKGVFGIADVIGWTNKKRGRPIC